MYTLEGWLYVSKTPGFLCLVLYWTLLRCKTTKLFRILPSDSGSMSLESGYVGSLDKVTRVQQRLFRRNKSAVINLSGGTVSGFIDCHFKVCRGYRMVSFFLSFLSFLYSLDYN